LSASETGRHSLFWRPLWFSAPPRLRVKPKPTFTRVWICL